MSAYQALIFTSIYSLYSSFESIWGQYRFDTVQVALTYLGPTLGFIVAAAIFVPLIERTYKRLEAKNDGKGVPEYRLPLANIGAVLLPVSLFCFGWAIEYQQAWPIPIVATALFGASHVAIFNTVQNYYIDSFEKYAASALAAGAFLRSLVGGIIPLFVGKMFEEIGYGWGMSIFGFIGVILMPAPLLVSFSVSHQLFSTQAASHLTRCNLLRCHVSVTRQCSESVVAARLLPDVGGWTFG